MKFFKKIILIGGIFVAIVGMLTGCGKKDDETKTYDRENEIIQNTANSGSYVEKISTEEKIKIAYYLNSLTGNFSSPQALSDENILEVLIDNNVNVVDYKKTTEQSVIDMFEDYDSDYCEIRVFKESELQKAASDLFGVNLTSGISNFNNAYLNRILKYDNGKYYYLYMQASGESLTIRNISNNGDTYTFFALNGLDSEEADISEFYKYEVVITNGVIKSCREAMETEESNNSTTENNTTNKTTLNVNGTYEFKDVTNNYYHNASIKITNQTSSSINFTIDAAHGMNIDSVNIGNVEGTATKVDIPEEAVVPEATQYAYQFVDTVDGKTNKITLVYTAYRMFEYVIVLEDYPDNTNPYAGHNVYFAGDYEKVQ